jgi:hypothetical protein
MSWVAVAMLYLASPELRRETQRRRRRRRRRRGDAVDGETGLPMAPTPCNV